MVRAHVSLTTIRQLVETKMIPRISIHRSLTCLHHAVGGVRWKSSFRQAPIFTATPARALIDEQVSIKGSFLPPRCPVTVCAQMHSDEGDLWEAFAHYNTDADGTVNLARDHSVGGSYLGCEPMGLFWGLQPAPGAREGLRLKKKDVETPYVVQMSLLEGHVTPSERQSTELAAVATERWYMAPGVQRKEIRQDGVVGTMFLPPGPGPFPAILDLWGMGGGLVEYRSALFASRGYVSLSLAYFNHRDLPGPLNRISVGDSYFKSAFKLLQDHPQVCGNRIGIIGLSYGVYLTLRMATQVDVNPSCLICINGPIGTNVKPSDADDETEPTDSGLKYWTYDDQGYVSFREISLPANLIPETKVKLENITCPLMYIVGEDDLSASSIENADVIEETLKAAGKSQLFTRLSYPGAGHLIEPPYAPNSRAALWCIKPRKMFTLWGGHPAPHAAAQEDSWKRVLDFMENNLRR
ncbi:peroxisomal succinyl-coenzyme A thioesterase-like isoform X2 [Plectropomus leopardus]|uniref:peroxisomal succinyl-coenzyme A thioesterase-like isoform X2 n=1 Tax=Plectropomus leopardus TaxID=160734 RepID=UPI001C4B094F|nr:peroxisomal succinyl-coenzyme A thioesterase-like isoform X2 [Plectropomus leopardus]XP_042356615.1 peroxisomal succinyl-coenzyme A thioesterase-like isoform X2 [Plectropomus leopardus]